MRPPGIIILMMIGVGYLGAGWITPSLESILDTLSQGKKIWVSVHLKEKPNLEKFPKKAYAQKIAYLKEFSQRSQFPVVQFVKGFGNKVDSIKQFWIYNGFCMDAEKEVIIAVANLPEVEFVNYAGSISWEQPIGSTALPRQIEWNIQRVRADEVWNMGYKGEGIVVCIFDSGMLMDHEAWWTSEIQNKWRLIFSYPDFTYAWFDATGQSGLPYDDQTGHGTHVGGIAIGGDGDPSGGIRDIGVAPGAKLIACRFVDKTDAHECFQWIVELTSTPYGNLASDVVNCSWGDQNDLGTSLEFWNDVKMLKEFDIIPVFCIGNYGMWMDPNWPPGNYPTTIGVGATDYNNIRAQFSCRGPSPDEYPWNDPHYWSRMDWGLMGVDIVAPGTKYENSVGIFSADANDPNGYVDMQGTSQATPHVTGAIALMLNASLDYWGYKLDYYDIYNILIDAANRDIGGPFPNIYYGWGRLDCKSAVDSVLNFHLKSSSPENLKNNNQRKMVYDEVNQIIHLVYQSGKYIRYTYSNDGGLSFSKEEKVSDGEYPCMSMDSNGNPHIVFKDGDYIFYARKENNLWNKYTIYEPDFYTIDIGEPGFAIYGNTGYIVFEVQKEWGSELTFGTFDITSQNPSPTYTVLESSPDFRFGSPCIAVNQDGVHVVYTRVVNNVREVYVRSSMYNWQLIEVSNIDDVKSDNPFMVTTSQKGCFFWEEGNPSDIYYRVANSSGWITDPLPVYESGDFSISPRAFYNTLNEDRVYLVWSERVNNQYDIYVSAYYGGWQAPTNISGTEVDSKYPELVYIPSQYIEGKLIVLYAEGNPTWLLRGGYLPIYRIKTYTTNLSLEGGVAGASGKDVSLYVGENSIRFHLPFKAKVKILLYDKTGRIVRKLLNKEVESGIYSLNIKGIKKGIYFVKFKAGNHEVMERILIVK